MDLILLINRKKVPFVAFFAGDLVSARAAKSPNFKMKKHLKGP